MAHGAAPEHARQTLILPYRGYGNARTVVLPGRVLRDRLAVPARRGERRWRNFATFIRLIESDEVPHARLRARFKGQEKSLRADREGYFRLELDVRGIEAGWHEVELELADHPGVHALGRVLVPSGKAQFGVVSDIDDTVVYSHVTSKLKMLVTIALSNAHSRKPFEGVAAFYRALARSINPFFYVSKSPWNLYDVIVQFLDVQGIPAGPVMLRDVDLGLDALSSRHHHTHKREMIHRVLNTYREVPVILIGDSSQQDPEIYREVVRDFAGRVRAVYIRNVSMNDERTRAIQALADEIVAAGSSLVLADDTLAAARHAAEHGFISPDTLDAIMHEKREDEGTTPGKTNAPGARDASDPPTPTIVVEEKSSGAGR